MATIYSAQSGNWSDPSTWSGGVKPAEGDTVILQVIYIPFPTPQFITHIIQVDESIPHLAALKTSGAYPVSSKCRLELTADTVMDIDMITGSTMGTTILEITGSAPEVTLTINCDTMTGNVIRFEAAGNLIVNGNLSWAGMGLTLNLVAGSGQTVINGSLTGGTPGGYMVKKYNDSLLTINGDIIATGSCPLQVNAGNVQVNGDVNGGVSSPGAVGISNTASGNTVTVNGNVAGGSIASHGISNTGGGHVIITGSVTGGIGMPFTPPTCGVMVSSGTVTVNGKVTGGTGASDYGIFAAGSSCKIYIDGDIQAGQINGSPVAGLYNGADSYHFHGYRCRLLDFSGDPGTASETGAINARSSETFPPDGYGWLVTAEVDSVADLEMIQSAGLMAGTFVQIADITVGWPTGEGFIPIGTLTEPFEGQFCGFNAWTKQAFIIDGLMINRSASYQGLFGYLAETACLSRIQLRNAQITADSLSGPLVGHCQGWIEQCYARATAAGVNTGGLVGYLGDLGRLIECYAISPSSTGGLCGDVNAAATIIRSYHNRSGDVNGIYEPESALKHHRSYQGWNFQSLWNLDAMINNGFPYLRPRIAKRFGLYRGLFDLRRWPGLFYKR